MDFTARRVGNPRIVPRGVAQCSWTLSANGCAPHEPWAAIELPDSLRNAVPKRQRHFRAGRYCAAQVLRALDSAFERARIGRAANGAPLWPAGVTGSITHTDDFVSAAAAWCADTASIGIDTERIVAGARARNLAPAVTLPGELETAAEAGCDTAQAFTLAFSAKEAVFKCLYAGVGRGFGFHDARMIEVHPSGTFSMRLEASLAPHLPAGTTLEGRFELDEIRVHTGVALPAGRLSR